MPIEFLRNKGIEISFPDYIEIFTTAVDSVIYSPAFDEKGLYLVNEDGKPISCIRLLDSKLTFYYIDGEEEEYDEQIIDIKVEETTFKKLTKMSLQGNLLQFGINDAIFYKLDSTKAFPEEIIRGKTRKRSI